MQLFMLFIGLLIVNLNSEGREKVQIQQSPSYEIICPLGFNVFACNIDEYLTEEYPIIDFTCGSKPDERDIKPYCVDVNSVIIGEPVCINYEEVVEKGSPELSEKREPKCELKESEGREKVQIQRSPSYEITCPLGFDAFACNIDEYLTEEYPIIDFACGSKPDERDIKPYCVDVNSVIIGEPVCINYEEVVEKGSPELSEKREPKCELKEGETI